MRGKADSPHSKKPPGTQRANNRVDNAKYEKYEAAHELYTTYGNTTTTRPPPPKGWPSDWAKPNTDSYRNGGLDMRKWIYYTRMWAKQTTNNILPTSPSESDSISGPVPTSPATSNSASASYSNSAPNTATPASVFLSAIDNTFGIDQTDASQTATTPYQTPSSTTASNSTSASYSNPASNTATPASVFLSASELRTRLALSPVHEDRDHHSPKAHACARPQ